MDHRRVVTFSVQFSTCCWDGVEVEGFKQRIAYLTYILQKTPHLPYGKSHPAPMRQLSAASKLAGLLKIIVFLQTPAYSSEVGGVSGHHWQGVAVGPVRTPHTGSQAREKESNRPGTQVSQVEVEGLGRR